MFGLTVEVLFGLDLGAPIAPQAATEVVVLALGAHPASVRETEILVAALARGITFSTLLRSRSRLVALCIGVLSPCFLIRGTGEASV